MTTTDEETVQQRDRAPAAVRQRPSSTVWLSAAIRVAIAVLVAGAVTAIAIATLWGPLHTKSDVIGYPIFADFNPYNYSQAYYLTVGLFPILALAIFLGLTWLGPRVGLATPSPRGPIRPGARLGQVEPSVDRQPSAGVGSRIAQVARVVFVGAVLGLEVGVASNHLWPTIVLVAIGYLLAVGLGSVILRRLLSARSPWELQLAKLNALGASITLGVLSLVSAQTGVRVLSDGTVQHFSWFPVWIAVPLTVALLGWILVSLRRADPGRVAAIERRMVLLIAAPVGLFVLVAHVPADLGQIGLFEEGQSVTEATLVGHGFLPWRDVVLTHGLLSDVAPAAVGWAIFGNSYWGAVAGNSLIFLPLAVVTTYWLLAYLLGRSWPMLAITALIFLGTWLGAVDARFLLWPLTLLLLAALLKRSTRVRSAALGLLVVAQAIATPETAPLILIVPAVVAAYEWYWRSAAMPPAQAFRRTLRLVIAIAAAVAVFTIYMAARGALGDVVYVTFNLVVGHTLDGAVPPNPFGFPFPQGEFDFIALTPVAALLTSFAYAAARLRLRRPFLLADWPMAAAAIFLLFYYSKFLARMDVPHAYQPYMVATPLIIYIVYRAVSAADGWIQRLARGSWPGWATIHPVGVALLILLVVLFWGPVRTKVEGTPAAYRPAVAAPAAFARVGYFGQFDGPAYEDLRQIINAYLGPRDRLMDITDEPGLFNYLLGRNPSSRWYAPNGIVDTANLQNDVLAELRRAPPNLIVFDDTDITMVGLPNMDGVPVAVRLYLISRWVLGHYRPLLESHGRTIYALPGVAPVSSLRLQLHQPPATVGLPFLGQQCSWGFAPTFLTGPAEPTSNAAAVPVRTAVARGSEVTLTGWAGDVLSREPAREVVATFNGKVVGRATPDTDAPDVTAAGYPSGFRRSGFQLSIPTWATAPKSLRVFAIGRDGSVAEIPIPPLRVQGGVARIGSRTVTLEQTADTGHVDSESPSVASAQIEPPAGSTWADYRWLEVDAPSFGRFLPGGFTLSDSPDATDPGHVISFNTLSNSPRRYIIPVSSCAQWQGYGSRPLYLTSSPTQDLIDVRLIR
jgi:hypothetical protein